VVVNELRNACAWVAERATHVRVQEQTVRRYAEALTPVPAAVGPLSSGRPELEHDAAFWLTLDAINFGSGWFPTLRKRAEPTGYRTIAAGVRRRFTEVGPWSADELQQIQPVELARWLDQDPDHELIGLFVRSLRDLGSHVQDTFSGLITAADGSAVALVETLAGWDCFADTSSYEGRRLPFLKRAQIAAADLHRAGVARFDDIDRLTMFADNLVPHVLRLDGVLWFEPDLAARIERGELIEHDSAEEIEIRACAVHAVELLAAASARRTSAPALDEILWNRGQLPAYKRVPRHRSRTTAY
jgi:hypothetical protein